MEKLMSMDLYALLDISPTASTKEIKTAYRKKALSCHPDKNPNNPLAASLFHELSSVLEILTDPSARSAYDKVVSAREQSKIRSAKLDAKRKKFKDDLEAREERFRRSEDLRGSSKTDEQQLREEIERLQKEGSKLVEEEVAFVNARIYEEVGKKGGGSREGGGDGARIKMKWKVAEGEEDNGGYSKEVLERIMGKYGDIEAVIVSGSKKGRALVEFKEKAAAELAVQIERGFLSNPLILEGLWSGGKRVEGSARRGEAPTSAGDAKLSFGSAPDLSRNSRGHGDFEEMVLKNLRRAEERKRLLEEMQEEEKSGS